MVPVKLRHTYTYLLLLFRISFLDLFLVFEEALGIKSSGAKLAVFSCKLASVFLLQNYKDGELIFQLRKNLTSVTRKRILIDVHLR